MRITLFTYTYYFKLKGSSVDKQQVDLYSVAGVARQLDKELIEAIAYDATDNFMRDESNPKLVGRLQVDYIYLLSRKLDITVTFKWK